MEPVQEAEDVIRRPSSRLSARSRRTRITCEPRARDAGARQNWRADFRFSFIYRAIWSLDFVYFFSGGCGYLFLYETAIGCGRNLVFWEVQTGVGLNLILRVLCRENCNGRWKSLYVRIVIYKCDTIRVKEAVHVGENKLLPRVISWSHRDAPVILAEISHDDFHMCVTWFAITMNLTVRKMSFRLWIVEWCDTYTDFSLKFSAF